MKKRVLYSCFNNECDMVIDALSQKCDWDPIFLLNTERMRTSSQKKYNNAFFFDMLSLRNAQFDYSKIGPIVPLDTKIITAMARYEFFILNLIEDTTGWNFSFHERLRYYYDLLQYFNTVIHRFKPEIFVSWTWPHTIVDYSLYQICNYYNIPVLMTSPVPLFNYGETKFYHANVSLEDQSKIFHDGYYSNEILELDDDLKNYFNSVRSPKGMQPPYITYYNNRPDRHYNPSIRHRWVKECATLVKLLFTGRLFKKINVSWKANKHPFESLKSKLSYLEFLMFRQRIRRDDRKLRKVYLNLISQPDFTKKYIYFAASFQPEAGIWNAYEYQLLILQILSAATADDWVIYYKEHPAQFFVGDRGSLFRDKHYYEKILKINKVQLVSSDIDTFKLIDSAQAVATPGGTVGWESAVRGIPALAFGHVWYQDCKSIFKIETFQDCVEAIGKINNGFKPDQKDIERFAAAVQRVCKKNIIHGDFVDEQIKACQNLKFEMERIAELFYETYQRMYALNESSEPHLISR